MDAVDPSIHVPLGYMHGDEKVYECNIIQESPPLGIRKVIPYERFDSYEKVFFESASDQPESLSHLIPIESGNYIKRDISGYYYEPEVSIKFAPYRFWYTLLCQRTQNYQVQKIFNYRINCIDKNNELSDALIQVFADAPDKNFVPKNIWINQKDLSVQSLANRPAIENDFLFIASKDGRSDAAVEYAIDYEALLSKHVNIWLCCSDIALLENSTAQLSKSILYNETISSSKHTFLSSSFSDKYLPAGGTTVKLFDGDVVACVVKHYKNKGFVIISSDQFIKKATDNYKMIYEVLSQIYLQSYVESSAISGYVCNEPVDYIVKRNSLIRSKGFRSEKTYYEYFNSYSAADFRLIDVILSDKNVKVSHSPDYVYFEKVGGPTDVRKPLGGYSILLETQEVAFVNKWHYVADTQIGYTTQKQEEYINLTLSPFCLNHVYTQQPIEIKLPIVTTVDYAKVHIELEAYYIVYSNTQFKCVKQKEWNGEGKVLLSAYICLKKAPIQLIDMRTRGGGLPLDKKDNYNLMDISHSEGRPFRKSGAYVVKLPLEAKPYHDEIMKKLEQINVAGKFYSIIYEQRSDDFEDN